ncbi:uncharacterized protein LOC134281723 [Saccostrea cucullata]|uniref:uncharacterized protein LOC134281723 n=1 Tax=Saccostrea cuccullata TaxID=36930 RepID=UPI002ED5A7A7
MRQIVFLILVTLYLTSAGISTEFKVRQCSQCQGYTEYYCNTCKQDFCLQCKEGHVTDLDFIDHYVVIYREKYEHIPKQETCVRHPDEKYEMFCKSCEIPVCSQCTEHRNHQILDIQISYKANRQQHRKTIQNIRSEILYKSCFLLKEIITDLESCHKAVVKLQFRMLERAQKLKNLIDSIVFDVESGHKSFIYRFLKEKRKKVIFIEHCEYRSEELPNKPVKFLPFLKINYLPKLQDTLQCVLPSLTEEINRHDLKKILREIHVTEKIKRQVENEIIFKQMSTPVLQKTINVNGVGFVRHLSCVTSDHVWISDYDSLKLINNAGEILQQVTDIKSYYGGFHTVDITSDLIYIDDHYNIITLSKDNGIKSTLRGYTEKWIPVSVYCSPFSKDLFVGMCRTDRGSSMVTRYNDIGLPVQTIQFNSIGQDLYTEPTYITENRNGDIVVSDRGRYAVVVTDRNGRYRFSYTGPQMGYCLEPYGICTDALSHILVCDGNSNNVQIIDKYGIFLMYLLTQQQMTYNPRGISYDNETHFLLVGSWGNTSVNVYRTINRQSYADFDRDIGYTRSGLSFSVIWHSSLLNTDSDVQKKESVSSRTLKTSTVSDIPNEESLSWQSLLGGTVSNRGAGTSLRGGTFISDEDLDIEASNDSDIPDEDGLSWQTPTTRNHTVISDDDLGNDVLIRLNLEVAREFEPIANC